VHDGVFLRRAGVEDAEKRIRAQWSAKKKADLADLTINNNG
jgi:dephospho-CoA kinase